MKERIRNNAQLVALVLVMNFWLVSCFCQFVGDKYIETELQTIVSEIHEKGDFEIKVAISGGTKMKGYGEAGISGNMESD